MTPRRGFLLDEHIHRAVAEGLRRRDLDALHIGEAGLSGIPDDRVLQASVDLDRILITRDIGDFIQLAAVYLRFDTSFPGILMVPPSIPEGDPGTLVEAIQRWTERYGTVKKIDGGIAWLTTTRPDDENGAVREARPPYQRALDRIGATI